MTIQKTQHEPTHQASAVLPNTQKDLGAILFMTRATLGPLQPQCFTKVSVSTYILPWSGG